MTGVSIEVHLRPSDLAAQLRADARAGLTSRPKWLPPRWFYDSRGSALFEEITRLPEYYPTRAEREILAAQAEELARLTTPKTLIELGSGAAEKTRLLLDAFRAEGSLGAFVPVDVSTSALVEATGALADDYPGLHVRGMVADFTRHLDRLPASGPRVVAFLGGTIGNLLPGDRARFLADLRSVLAPGEWLLLGADLVKDPAVLIPAYDDAAGVTAEFNRNVLHVLNRELGADFDVDAFTHRARWDSEHEWIEMRLRAARPMTVRLSAIDTTVDFQDGEELWTETSAKFRREGLVAELAEAGFAVRRWWTDRRGWFSLSLAEAVLT